MTFAVIVLAVLSVFVILFRHLENKLGTFSQAVNSIRRWQGHTHDRISSLEVKDFNQDFRLDDQEKALEEVSKDLNELSKDIGWSDDRRKTDVIKKPDDNNGDT